jgi:hypothetical protein
MEVGRLAYRRAVDYIFRRNIPFYTAFIINLLGVELIRGLIQYDEIEAAREFERPDIFVLWANGRRYDGRDQILEYVAERIAGTFPTWLGRLWQFLITLGLTDLMNTLMEYIYGFIRDEEEPVGFVRFVFPPPPPPPPPPPFVPLDPRYNAVNAAAAGKPRRRGGSNLKMTDPRNTPEPKWVKEILRE